MKTVYRSTDVGAPKLPAGRDAFTNFLSAILVTGYGSKAGAGWTVAFTATGIRVFKQGAGGNNRFLRVYNAATVTDVNYGKWWAYIAAYENMTAVSTGTARFPTTAQVSGNGLTFSYRTSAPTTDENGVPLDIPWMCIASSSFFMLFVNSNAEAEYLGGPDSTMMFFGKFDSDGTATTYDDIIGAGQGVGYPSYMSGPATFSGAFVTRNYTGVGSSVPAALKLSTKYPGATNYCTGMTPYPEPVTQKLVLDKIQIVTSPAMDYANSTPRGVLPWVWSHPHPTNTFLPNQQFQGSGASAGKEFEVKNMSNMGAMLIVETSDTWS